MNTQEVANKWVQMCREGKNLACIEALYADDITSKEMPGVSIGEVITGKRFVLEKGKKWFDNVLEHHGSSISEPVIAGNHFTSKMIFDVTFKDSGRQHMEELAVFEVVNSKIVNEQFFYTM